MTIHGSKSELKQLRYLKDRVGRVSLLLEAISFDPTIGFSISLVFWKLYIHTFPETPRLAQSESRKVHRYAIKVREEKDKIADASVPDLAHPKGPPSLGNSAKWYKHP